MIKRGIIFLLIILILPNVYASLDLNLSKVDYGEHSAFNGILSISGDYSGSDRIMTKISGDKGINIIDYYLIDDVIDFDLESAYFELDGRANELSFNGKGYFGLYLPTDFNEIKDISFNLEGSNVGPIAIDVGDDGEDWRYVGSLVGWSGPYYPDNVDEDVEYDEGMVRPLVKDTSYCEYIDVNFISGLSNVDLRVKAIASKSGSGKLKAKVNDKECELEGFNSGFSEVSCRVALDNPINDEVKVCVKTDVSNVFEVPWESISGVTYYFIKIDKGVYEDKLNGVEVVTGKNIVKEVQDYVTSCVYKNGYCIVPFKIESIGNVLLNNMKVVEKDDRQYVSLYKLNKTDESLNIDDKIELTSFDRLYTPNVNGSFTLEINIGGDKDSFAFKVKDLPVVKIVADRTFVEKNGIVKLISEVNRNNVTYVWDFAGGKGGTNFSEAEVSWTTEGSKEVTLEVIDGNGLVSNKAKIIIHVGKFLHTLGGDLKDKEAKINNAYDNYNNAGSVEKEVYGLMGWGTGIESAKTEIDNLVATYDNINISGLTPVQRETQYGVVLERLNALDKKLPVSFDLKVFDIENWILKLDDMVDLEDYGKSGEAYKNKIYTFNQKNVDVRLTAYEVNVNYLEGSESFVLVKERVDVDGGSGNILVIDFSDVVSSLNDIEFISEYEDSNGREVSYDIVDALEVKYKFDNILLSDVNKIISVVIGDFQTGTGFCGDGLCTLSNEDKDNCPEDCQRKVPWVWFFVLFLVLSLGAYYINFYTGPYNFKELVKGKKLLGKASSKKKKEGFSIFKSSNGKVFNSDKDRIRIENYVRNAIAKGVSRTSIKLALRKAGWKEEQIDYAIGKK